MHAVALIPNSKPIVDTMHVGEPVLDVVIGHDQGRSAAMKCDKVAEFIEQSFTPGVLEYRRHDQRELVMSFPIHR